MPGTVTDHGDPTSTERDHHPADLDEMADHSLRADLFVISTAVDAVALDFGTPRQRWLERMTVSEACMYLDQGSHFAEGSMAPKVRAAVAFVEGGGAEALITSPD